MISSFSTPKDAFIMMLLWKEEENDHLKANVRESFMGEEGAFIVLCFLVMIEFP